MESDLLGAAAPVSVSGLRILHKRGFRRNFMAASGTSDCKELSGVVLGPKRACRIDKSETRRRPRYTSDQLHLSSSRRSLLSAFALRLTAVALCLLLGYFKRKRAGSR